MPKELDKLRDWEKELKRQCEIRNLPFTEVKYLVDEMFQERDKLLVDKVEAKIYEHLEKCETKDEVDRVKYFSLDIVNFINNIEPK